MEQNFKSGDYVYFIDNYNNNHEGEIFNILSSLKYKMVFYSIKTRYGTFTVPIYDIFKTKEDRDQARIKRYNKKVQEYCEKINDITDLVFFMFGHNVAFAEEYTDWEAREAARIKANQFGINLI